MVQLTDHSPWTLLAAGVLAVLGVARATRLWVFDAWPPVAWLRGLFLGWAEQTRHVPARRARQGDLGVPGHDELTWRAGWAPLATCPFCVAPWFALASLAWAYWSGLSLTTVAGQCWWLAHLWFAGSYLAAMVVVRDEPEDD